MDQNGAIKMSSNIVALDESKIKDFNAWMQVVTSELNGDVACAIVISLSKDRNTSELFAFQADAGDATFIAALATDYAKMKRDGER